MCSKILQGTGSVLVFVARAIWTCVQIVLVLLVLQLIVYLVLLGV